MTVLAEETEKKDTILYFFDPLCGWCYGFSPVIRELAENHYESFHFEVIPGGMITGNLEGPIGDRAEYILGAIPRLEKTTGIKIGQPYIDLLHEGSYFTSSVRPSLAFMAYKAMGGTQEVHFAAALQKALFLHGKSFNEDETYRQLAKEFRLNPDGFVAKMNDPATEKEMIAEFEFTQKSGIDGFPAVFGKRNGQYYALTNGYSDKEELAKKLEVLKKM